MARRARREPVLVSRATRLASPEARRASRVMRLETPMTRLASRAKGLSVCRSPSQIEVTQAEEAFSLAP